MANAAQQHTTRVGLRPPRARSVGMLTLLVALALVTAGAGAFIAQPAFDGWYGMTAKPMWAPHETVFVPVWVAGYLMMAIAGWLIWRRPESTERSIALKLYAGQFALTALWAPAFFGLGVTGASGPWLALAVLVVLDIVMLATIFRVWEVHRGAALLIVPAFVWALFVTTLNSAVAVLAM